LTRKQRTADSGLTKVAVQCSADTFVVKIATFAKPQNVEQDNALSANEWNHYINKSYNLVMASLPKKIRQSIIQINGK